MRGMRFILCRLALALAFWPAAARAAADPEISIRDIPFAWTLSPMTPVHIDIRSERGARAEITVRAVGRDAFTVRRSVNVPANSAVTVEIPVWDGGGGRVHVECRGGGVTAESTMHTSRYSLTAGGDKDPVPIVCVNGFLQREVDLYRKPAEKERLRSVSAPIDSLPRHWQSYAALADMILFEVRDVEKLRPEQREALAMWVKWLGGMVWLVGPEGDAAAAGLGLAPPLGRTLGDGPVRSYPVLRGRVYLQEAAAIDDLVALSPVGMPDFSASRHNVFANTLLDTGIEDELIRDLGGVSTAAIVVCLGLLGVVMGPVNFWYIRRKKRPILFFVTTPLIAFAGTLLVIFASMAEEGFGGRYNEFALLMRNENGSDAMLVNARGVRPGFFAPVPSYPASALVAPVRSGWATKEYAATLRGDDIELTAGWFMPRFPTAMAAALPVASRMNIDIVGDKGDFYAVNNLGYVVKDLAAALPGGGFGRAENIPPGGRALLKTGRSGAHLSSLADHALLPVSTFGKTPNLRLAAECAGLPNIEDWGVGGSLNRGTYYYCVMGDGEAQQ